MVDSDHRSMSQQLALSTTQELRDGLVPAAFNEAVIRDGLSYVRRRSFPVVELTLEQLVVLGDVELAERYPAGGAVLLRVGPDMLVKIVAGGGHGTIEAAGRDRDAVDAVVADLVGALREAEPTDDEVPITFLANASGRMIEPRRRISAPSWDEIRGNYSVRARGAGRVDGRKRAGTGRPAAVARRAGYRQVLCAAGAGARVARLVRHVLHHRRRRVSRWADELPAQRVAAANRGREGEHRWRLVVLEDAGELLAADARAVAGQGLSRLLNLADGLLGEGLRVVVLVTTNEPLRRLHPAVVRPGRTWAEVEFGDLTRGGERVAEAHVSTSRVDGTTSLAELFAIVRGRRPMPRVAVGFAAQLSCG